VIQGPLVTERSYSLYQQGRYTFRVAKDATKPEIARALEEVYEAQGIRVLAVNTIRVRG
jgi:large subunit ribosomal protein L23